MPLSPGTALFNSLLLTLSALLVVTDGGKMYMYVGMAWPMPSYRRGPGMTTVSAEYLTKEGQNINVI